MYIYFLNKLVWERKTGKDKEELLNHFNLVDLATGKRW